MGVTETFGRLVEDWSLTNPDRARWLLKTGWQAQNLRFRFAPEKRLMPADQYLARMMMDMMLKPLKQPESSAIVSIFTPCELLQEVGLHPYNVESYSCYLAASRAERDCLQQAENCGLPETLCSYHKTFLGAAEKGLLPRPRCIVYTNLICDANLVTFRCLAEQFQVPLFLLDVPLAQTAENVAYVEGQLRELAAFLERHTGRPVKEDSLSDRLARSRRTLENIDRFQSLRAERYVPTDLVTPLYAAMTANVLLGTREEEAYTEMLLRDVAKAAPARGKRIYWMHTIPYWSEAVKARLCLSEEAQIVGCELTQFCPLDFDPARPFAALAHRLVYHYANGGARRRIQAGIAHARQAGAHGAVWFCHWGCKSTLGSAQLAKAQFEAAGIPLLLLDGDGCDRSHGGEGQTATRLGAFLEMLESTP